MKNRKNIRLKNFDYSSDGAYFFTICTKDKEHFFGEIKNGVMCINEVGKIAWKCWEEIPEHFPSVKREEFIVMPNHIHGVLWIDSGKKNEEEKYGLDVGMRFIASEEKQQQGAINRATTTSFGGVTKEKNPMIQDVSLSKIIRFLKGKATFEIRKINQSFSWQKSFHDRIIRNEKELENFCNYTKYNPKNWEKDEENIYPNKNIFLALGSNVGDRKKMLEAAVNEIKKIATIKKYSHIWESEPWGETDQDAFLNAVIEIETEKNPYIFLEEIQKIEKKIGRKKRYKWGPREIDIDILFWGKEIVGNSHNCSEETRNAHEHSLHIPHPFWNKRDFVIFPMADIAENFLPPESKKTIDEWKKEFSESEISIFGDFLTQ